MRIVTIIGIILVLVGIWFTGFLVGGSIFLEKDAKKEPKVGYLQFNVDDPTKEFLELHITQDLDIEHPPEYVKLLVLVSEKGGRSDGSKS